MKAHTEDWNAPRGYCADEESHDPKTSVAIVGGGVVGVILAHGLLQRGIHVAIYERAANFHETGAGFAFTAVARDCMTKLSPKVIEAMNRVGIPNKRPFDNYWDGYHVKNKEDSFSTSDVGDPEGNSCELLFTRPNHQLDFWGCLRTHFLNEVASSLPADVIHFKKELTHYIDPSPSPGPVTLYFADGTTAIADALIGCDGLRSHVRAQLVGDVAPQAVKPSYTHKRCYRTVVPLSSGEAVLGSYKANNQCMHVGPGAHVLTYPVGNSLMNIVLFISDPQDWPDYSRMVLPGRREDLLSALQEWGPATRGLVALFSPEPSVWGIFDMFDNPAPFYANGRVCIAGDAAHGSAPHHGAGAGFGIEDALVIAIGMEEVLKTIKITDKIMRNSSKTNAITAAFHAFNHIRYKRTQWLVRSSREAGDIYQWQYEKSGNSVEEMRQELNDRFKIIWDFDVERMLEKTKEKYNELLGNDFSGI